MITTINEYKIFLLESKLNTLKNIKLILENNSNQFEWDLSDDQIREFEWDLTNDIKDDVKLINKINAKSEIVIKYFRSLLQEILNLPKQLQLKLFKILIISFTGLIAMDQVESIINNTVKDDALKIQYKDVIIRTYKKNIDVVNNVNNKVITKYINPTEYSDTLVEFLKHEEGSIKDKGEPVLTAYNIGDGMITIGYGHAESTRNTKMISGKTKITKDQAIDLLIEDINEAQSQLDEILNTWKKEGIEINITQGMYDSMISMIYNMGIGNFRKTDFIQLVKQNKYKEAQEKIKTTMISYPGHVHRRNKESILFGLTDVSDFNYA